MAAARVERRLTAILAADIVGYSRLVERDEAGTLAAIRALRREAVDPQLAEHHGRVVKLMGDGIIAEFGSVVDAVACAVAVQRGVAARQAGVPPERRIVFRIGVNLGDVVVKGDGEDLLGDGVNVAARLEQLCDPGGVLISGTAFDHLKGKLDLALEPRGEQRLKNLREPVRTYRVRMGPATGAIRQGLPRRRGMVVVASLALLVVAGLAAAWLRPWRPTVEAASVERMAFPLPDKPSLAVLPFRNVGGGPEQDHFVDGLTDDLITDLSKVSGLFVIARDSVFPFKGRDPKVRDVAESLGVRYVVDGGVRRAGDTVRINVQLVDALTGGQLWADRYDGGLDDIFAVQDRFVRVIVDALALKLSEDEEREIGRGQTRDVDAREAFQKGWERILRFTGEDNALAVADLRKAIELDPDYGRAYTALGLALFRSCAWDWTKPAGMNRPQTCEMASRYLAEAKRHPSSLTHVVATYMNLNFHEYEAALAEAARALTLEPNDPDAAVAMAWVMLTTGRPQAALDSMRTAMRINPRYPNSYALVRGLALFSSGALTEAARVLEEALERSPTATELAPPLAATYAHLGRRQDARDMLLRWKPGASQDELNDIVLRYPYTFRWSSDGQKALDRLDDGMIIAAMPLDITVLELADALQRGGAFERARAARTLARFGPQAADAVPALVRALGDPSRVVRSAAITALAKIGPKAKAAVPALTDIPDAELRPLADDAMKEIGGG